MDSDECKVKNFTKNTYLQMALFLLFSPIESLYLCEHICILESRSQVLMWFLKCENVLRMI